MGRCVSVRGRVSYCIGLIAALPCPNLAAGMLKRTSCPVCCFVPFLCKLLNDCTGKRKSDTICVKCKASAGKLVIRHSVYCKYVTPRPCSPSLTQRLLQGVFHPTRIHKVSPSPRASYQPRTRWIKAGCTQTIWKLAHRFFWRSWIYRSSRSRT